MAQQPDPPTLALIAAYQAQAAQLRANLAAYIQRVWRSLGEWRQPQMRTFIGQAVPTVAGAQRQIVSLTAAYLAAQRQASIGGRLVPVAVDSRKVTGSAARNGADPREVYERPFHLVWRQLAELPREPGSVDKAITAGLDRAVELALTDVQLSKVQTSQKVIADDSKAVGYRRVLEGTHSCGLCIVASTNRYHKSELLPMHPACDCGTAVIYEDSDPGDLLQATARDADGNLVPVADLADVHDRIEQRFGRSSSAARVIPGARDAKGRIVRYRDVLIVHDHGELGPVLGVRGEPFLGPSGLH